MINYLLINIILSSSALAINQWLQIPYRLRFYSLMIAVISWLIPFGLLSIQISRESVATWPAQVVEFNLPISAVNQAIEKQFDFKIVFAVLMMAGLFLFIRDLLHSQLFIKKLKPTSKPLNANQQIRVTEKINGAFVSGYFKPIIWVSQNFSDKESLQTIIVHEKQHIKSHDQFWLIIITFIQRLMWFNPVMNILSNKTRKAIELSCDEACKHKLGTKTYQSHLAEIMLNNSQSAEMILHNSINQNKNFNINRIEQLNQELTMNQSSRIKLSIIATTLLTICLFSLTTVAGNNETSQLKDDEVMMNVNWRVTEVDAGMLHNTEVNSDIVVNSKDFNTFEIADYKIKVKAQLANEGSEPKAYLISTKIIGETNFPVSEPAIMVVAGKTATFRMVDSESKDEVKPQIVLSFTVPNNKINKSPTPTINTNSVLTPSKAPEPIQPPQPLTTPALSVVAPIPEMTEPAPKPQAPPKPPRADLIQDN